jgi:branched-chain amino acid transport system permease protein
MPVLRRKGRFWASILALLAVAAVIAVWKPYALIQGLQRGGLYALIALPMALILGVVGIVNLAHGEFMMLGSYFAYWISVSTGIDPLVAMVPAFLAFFIVGALTYYGTIKPVLKAPELNQLLITFGLAMSLTELANLLWTSRPRKLPLPYVYSSATIDHVTFGTFGFAYLAGALVLLFFLLWFLRHTRAGQAALAVGQNPRGAALVGIDVGRTYLFVFSLSIALVGAIGALFLVGHSIFPGVGSPYTLKSFCLIATAGVGNLPGILWASIGLGMSEALVSSFRGYGGWADLVFFALLIVVIMVRSYRRRVT